MDDVWKGNGPVRSRFEKRFWDGPQPLGAGVDRVMRHLDAPAPGVVEGVFARWPELVGDLIASHAQPARIRDGELLIEADSPEWASELQWMGEEILNQIRTKLGSDEITEVAIRVRR